MCRVEDSGAWRPDLSFRGAGARKTIPPLQLGHAASTPTHFQKRNAPKSPLHNPPATPQNCPLTLVYPLSALPRAFFTGADGSTVADSVWSAAVRGHGREDCDC